MTAPHSSPPPLRRARRPDTPSDRVMPSVGWLLQEPFAPEAAADAGIPPDLDLPRAPGRAIRLLHAALDARSPIDCSRWLRLREEASRWTGWGP